MQLLKKISFYFFVSLSLACAIWGYFKLKESKEPNSNVLEHISNKTFCVIETNNYNDLINQLIRQNIIWNNFTENSQFKKAQDNASYFDSLVTEHAELKTLLDENKLFLSCYKNSTQLNYLIQFKIKEESDEDKLTAFFEKNLILDKTVSSFLCYFKTIHNQKWLISVKNGIVYISSDLNILKESLALKKEESLFKNQTYLNLLKINGKQNTSVFLNSSQQQFFNLSMLNMPSVFTTNFNLNQISLSGYSQIDNSSIFTALQNQKPQTINFYSELPNNPISFTAIAISDAPLFLQKIKNNGFEKWNTLNDTALYDIKTEFLNTLNGGIISANYQLNDGIETITLLKTNDFKKNKSLFKLISDSSFIDGETEYFKINPNYLNLFSWLPKNQKNNFVSVKENIIAIYSTINILKYHTNSLKTSSILSKNSFFMDYATNNLVSSCNYMYYENVELLKLNKQNSIINTSSLKLKESPYSHLSLIATQADNLMKLRINLIKENNKHDELNISNYLWAFEADAKVNTNLNLFTNHTTQENELTFQDSSNTLYLTSSTGNTIWKKKLSEQVLSKIYTVDIFKNGKFQMLFNTKNYIHLLDRNGNYVQNYPLKAPSFITSPITLLDYNLNKDYRIFIACADKKIYNFSLYGVKTEGFVPFKTNDVVELPISYTKIGLSDYLITSDVTGNIYAFSRKGLGRIDFKNKTIQSLHHLTILEGTSIDNTKLIYIDDKNNLLCKISLTDKKEIIKIGDNLTAFNVSFNSLGDNNQKSILCFGNGAFYGYDLFINKSIEYFNDKAVYTSVELIKTTRGILYIAFDQASQKTDLINSSGKLIKQFSNCTHKPLVGDLYKNGKQFILMINNNKVNCVEID